MANPRGNPRNLKEAWKPGESGNPAGTPKGYRSVQSYMNDMGTLGEVELQRVADGKDESANKRIAAKQMLRAMHAEDGKEFDRVCDRQSGKPSQPVNMNVKGELRVKVDI